MTVASFLCGISRKAVYAHLAAGNLTNISGAGPAHIKVSELSRLLGREIDERTLRLAQNRAHAWEDSGGEE